MSTTDIDYKIIVVEQDDSTSFNRGKLLNIGAIQAKDLGCDYVVFHDVDMIPVDVDYSYSENPVHLASNFVYGHNDKESTGIHFEKYFGGVTMFPLSLFEDINGYSNEYWGWGFEDDDLFFRVASAGLPTDFKKDLNYTSSTAGIRLNGETSYIRANNTINFRKPFTIHLSFNPIDLILNHEKDSDRYTLFSIPGYDFNIYYDSFKRYNVEIFDKRGNIFTIVSEITEPKPTKVTVVYNSDERILQLFVDGKLVGQQQMKYILYNYSKYRDMYIGCSNREEGTFVELNYFKGTIDTVAVYQKALEPSEIETIAKNNFLGLGANFEEYKSSDALILYYDPKVVKHYKLMDLSFNGNNGDITDCWFEPIELKEFINIPIPFRRQCTFRLLDHKPGGYLNGRWKDQLTRYNQLKYSNETLTGIRDSRTDGLNTCEYRITNEINSLQVQQITVKI